MKRFWNLYEGMWTMENLTLAHKMARKDKKLYKEVQMVDSNPEYRLWKIRKLMLEWNYHISPSDYSVSVIRDKTKQRELWKLKYYPHRIIQRAIMLKLEPVFNKVFCNHVCASIKGRGWKQVMDLTKKYLEDEVNSRYCLKIDVKKFYPNINHRVLKRLLRKKFKDKKLLELLDMIIDSFPWRKGLPIWSYISQFLANYYLAYFDHFIKEDLRCKRVVRYMDDIIILDRDKKHLRYVLKRIRKYLWGYLCLQVKENRQIFPVEKRWIDFVGYRYFHKYILLRKSTCLKMKRKVRKLLNGFTSRRNVCWMISYMWWLSKCNSYRLWEKYVNDVIPSLVYYYVKNVNPEKGEKFKRNLLRLHV